MVKVYTASGPERMLAGLKGDLHMRANLGRPAIVVVVTLLCMGRTTLRADVQGAASATPAQPTVVQNNQVGFVVTHFAYALAADADRTGACADGMTAGYSNMGNVFVGRPDLVRGDGEQEQPYLQRMFAQTTQDSSIRNLCLNPELGKADPNWRSVKGSRGPVEGIDLDGQDSHIKGKVAPGTCAHDDFPRQRITAARKRAGRFKSCHIGITANSELDRQELRSRHVRPISAKTRQQVVSPRLRRYRTPVSSGQKLSHFRRAS